MWNWNKENRRKGVVNRQQKYEQAMEQLLERDGRIREIAGQLEGFKEEVKMLQGNKEDLIKQNNHYRTANARLEADLSQVIMEKKELRDKLDYYKNISD